MISKVLGAVILALAILSGWLGLSLHSVKQSYALAQAQNAACSIINDSQTTQVKQLAGKVSALTTQNAADMAAAEEAAARYNVLEARYTAQSAENEAYRDELERKHTDTATWMGAGMDRRVACSLWPGSASCSN